MTVSIHQSGVENAPTILFLHGLGVSSWMWTEQVEVLQNRYRCLAIDLPGNGDSFAMPWTSFSDTADVVADVIRDNCEGGTAHVVGLSLGGYVGLKLLANHPQTVASMVVSGVTLTPILRPAFINPVSALMARLLTSKLMGRISAKLIQIPTDVLPYYYRDVERLAPLTVKRVYQELSGGMALEISADATSRLLMVAGDREAKPILNSLTIAKESLSHATTAIAPNAHHVWNAEHPQLFTDMIDLWLNEHKIPAALNSVYVPEFNSV